MPLLLAELRCNANCKDAKLRANLEQAARIAARNSPTKGSRREKGRNTRLRAGARSSSPPRHRSEAAAARARRAREPRTARSLSRTKSRSSSSSPWTPPSSARDTPRGSFVRETIFKHSRRRASGVLYVTRCFFSLSLLLWFSPSRPRAEVSRGDLFPNGANLVKSVLAFWRNIRARQNSSLDSIFATLTLSLSRMSPRL